MTDADISRAELVALVREQAAIIVEQRQTIARLDRENAELRRENAELRRENAELREQLEVIHYRVSQMSRRIYGNLSERIVDADQQMIPGLVPSLSAELETDDDPDDDGPRPASKPPSAKRRGRLKIPDHIPREDRVIEPDPQSLRHPSGQRMVKLREEVSEKLDYIAGGYRAVRIIRPVYGIPNSDDMTISAPPPAQVVERGLPTDRLVAMVLCEKFDLHNHSICNSNAFSAQASTCRAQPWPIGLALP